MLSFIRSESVGFVVTYTATMSSSRASGDCHNGEDKFPTLSVNRGFCGRGRGGPSGIHNMCISSLLHLHPTFGDWFNMRKDR